MILIIMTVMGIPFYNQFSSNDLRMVVAVQA